MSHVHTRRAFLGAAMLAAACARAAAPPVLRIRRLTWAGVFIEYGDTTICIDPLTSSEIWEGAWKEPVVPIEPKTPRRIGLITHLHNDHFDPAAMKLFLADKGRIFCHNTIATDVASRGFRVSSIEMYQALTYDEFTVICVPAADGIDTDQVSWIVSAGGKRIIHCGDTVWHRDFRSIGKAYGPFDAAFLPMNGARFPQLKPDCGVPLTMTPEQAVGAALLLGAKIVVPIHYGLNDPGQYEEYPNAIATFTETAQKRGVAVKVLKSGDWLWQ